jgi:hypothetical protein
LEHVFLWFVEFLLSLELFSVINLASFHTNVFPDLQDLAKNLVNSNQILFQVGVLLAQFLEVILPLFHHKLRELIFSIRRKERRTVLLNDLGHLETVPKRAGLQTAEFLHMLLEFLDLEVFMFNFMLKLGLHVLDF